MHYVSKMDTIKLFNFEALDFEIGYYVVLVPSNHNRFKNISLRIWEVMY